MDSTTNNTHNNSGDNSAEEKQVFRPELSPNIVTQLARELYGLHVLTCRELDSYDDRNFLVTVDPQNVHNTHISEIWPHGYVLKVLNAKDSKRPEVIEAKNTMMMEAAKKGIPTSRIIPSSETGQLHCLQLLTREGVDQPDKECGSTAQQDIYLVRLMEYLPGATLATVTLTPQLSFQVGQVAARLDLALKDVDDSRFPELIVDWNMQNVPSLGRLLRFFKDAEKAKVVTDVIKDFDEKVLRRESGLQTGLIHSDFNDHNIIVGPMTDSSLTASSLSSSSSPSPASTSSTSTSTTAMCVCGIIDYGDSTKSFLLIEAAIAMNYMSLLCPADQDPDVMAGHVLAGYQSEIQLSREEVELIPLTMCARFAQTLATGFQRLALDPDNEEYCMVHANKAWPHLQRLWTRPVAETLAVWQRVSDSLGVAFPASD